MAVQDSENPSHPGARLSPGDAAFERLRQREALRSRDESAAAPEIESAMFIGPPVDPAIPPAPSTARATATPPVLASSEARPPPAIAPRASAPQAGEPADRILAMAAAFGIEAASPASVDETPVAIEHAAPVPWRRIRLIPPRPWRQKSPILFRPPSLLRPLQSRRRAPRFVARRRPRPATPLPPGWRRRCSISSSRSRKRWSRTLRPRPRGCPAPRCCGRRRARPERRSRRLRRSVRSLLRTPSGSGPMSTSATRRRSRKRTPPTTRPGGSTSTSGPAGRPQAVPCRIARRRPPPAGRHRWPPRSMTARPKSKSAGAASAP